MNALVFDSMVGLAGTLEYPSARGRFTTNHLVSLSRQTLATDPVGLAHVTFAGVPAGSEIRVYLPDQIEAAGVELCDADHQLSWYVYAPGSPNNVVRILVINTAYKIKEFSYTSSVGYSSLPIQPEPDKWFSNPA